jgi:hypothetical protein
MEAPPCTQMIAKSVAGIAMFDFFISKIYNSKDFGKKFPRFSRFSFYVINREINHVKLPAPKCIEILSFTMGIVYTY